MPATDLPAYDAPGSYTTGGVVVAAVTGDTANGNQFTATGRDLLRVENISGGSALFIMTSMPAPVTGRLGNVNVSLAAGEVRYFGPMALDGWVDSNGKIQIPTDGVFTKPGNFKFELIRVPK